MSYLGDFGKHSIHSEDSSAVLTEDTDNFIIGQKVWVSGTKPGHIAFIGETQFAPGEWAGIALDEPIGKNDGSVGGIRYFQCEPKKGVFARLTRLTRFPLAQETMRSGDTDSSPINNGVRRSPVSPTGSTKGALKSSTSICGSNISLSSAASHIMDYKLGDRVIIKSSQGSKVGTVRYIGTTEFANGDWVGVELDDPRGKNDGSLNGKRYFECRPNFGLFAPVAKVSKSPSKIKPNACQIHALSSDLSPSGILKRSNSKESMLSNLSLTSASSNIRRVRLGVTSLTPKTVTPKTTTASVPTRTALQDVLKEKQVHIEQLLKERDLERAEITKAANQAEEAEQRLVALRQEYVLYRAECENQLQDHMHLLNKLKEDRTELVALLDEEKKKTEDLMFRLAESSIFKEDMEVVNDNNLKKIIKLEETLQKEREKVENLESDANKLFEAEENLIKAKEEIDFLRKQLQDIRDRQLVLEGDSASTSVLIASLQKEVDQHKNDVEERDEIISVLKQKIAKITTDLKKQIQDILNQKNEMEALYSAQTNEIPKIKLELNQVNNLLQDKIIELEKISNEKLISDTLFEKEIDKLKIELSTKLFDLKNISQNNKDKNTEIEQLRKQLELTETYTQVKDSEIGKLKTDLFQLINQRNSALEHYKQQNWSLQAELNTIRSELKKAKLNLETDIELKENFNELMEEKDFKITQIEFIIQEKSEQNSKLSDKCNEMKNELDTKCDELESLKTKNEALIKALENLNLRVSELHIDYNTLKEKVLLIQSLQTELQTTKVDLESITSNLLQQQTNIGDVESALKKECDEIKESLMLKVIELKEPKKVFSESNSQKNDEINEQASALSNKTAQIERIRKELEALSEEKVKNTVEIVENYSNDIKHNNKQLVCILNSLRLKCKQLNDFELKIKELNEKLAQQCFEYQKLKEILEYEIKDSTSQSTFISKSINKIEYLRESKEQLESKCIDSEKNKFQLEENYLKRDNEIKLHEDKISNIQETLDQTTKDLGNYQNNHNEVETQLKIKDEMQKFLENKNEELKLVKIEKNEKLRNLKKNFAESKLDREKNSQKIIELTKENNDLWDGFKFLINKTFNFFNETTSKEERDLSLLSDCFIKWEENFTKKDNELKNVQENFKELSEKFEVVNKNAFELQQQIIQLTEINEEIKKNLTDTQKLIKSLTDEKQMLQLQFNNITSNSTELSHKIIILDKELESKEQTLAFIKSESRTKIEMLEKTVQELQENEKKKAINIEKQKNEYEEVIKTISESENALRNQLQFNNDAVKVKDLEVKLKEFISKLDQKDKMIAFQNEEIMKMKEELKDAKPHEHGLDQIVVTKLSEDPTKESLKYQQLLEEKIFVENQVTFLNSIIADMQKKNEAHQARIDILETGYNAAAAEELASLGFNREVKVSPPRIYCDICEEFDFHETEDCPTQGDDAFLVNQTFDKISKEKPSPRVYCEICEAFGHTNEECTNMDQEF